MSDQKLEAVCNMMRFLSVDNYIIPHHGLPVDVVDMHKSYYRSDRTYRFHVHNKKMTYNGHGRGESNITIPCLSVPDVYLNRMFLCLKEDCKRFIETLSQRSDMEHLPRLLAVFSGLKDVLVNLKTSSVTVTGE